MKNKEKKCIARKEIGLRAFSNAKLMAILVISILIGPAVLVYSQTPKVTILKENVEIEVILKEIKKQTRLGYLLSNDEIPANTKVSVNVNNVTVEEALKQCFKNLDLGFKIIDGVIIVTPNKKSNNFDINSKSLLFQKIRGTVIDKISKTPLPGVNVIINGTNPVIGTSTDINGKFRLENVPLGRYSLVISGVGYEERIVSEIYVESAKEVIINIQLTEAVFKIAPITINALNKGEPLNGMAYVSSRSFSSEETERYAGSWGDPARMVSNFAGVSSPNISVGTIERNDIIIRGNSPFGLLWRLDGINIPNPNHFGTLGTTGGVISILNNNLLTNSDFYTSAFPAEFGNAIAGTFDLKMRTGNNEKREYVGEIGFNGFELGTEGPISKEKGSSYLINYRYSFLGLLQKLGMDFGPTGTVPKYSDVSFKIDFPKTKIGRISVFGIGGIDKVSSIESNKPVSQWAYKGEGEDFRYNSNMGTIGFSNLFFFNNTTRLKTSIAFSGAKSSTSFDSVPVSTKVPIPDYDDNYKEVIYSFSSQISKKFNPRDNASFGATYDLYQVNYKDSFLNDNELYVNVTNVSGNLGLLQAYGEFQHKFSDQFSIYSGIHLQYFTLNEKKSIEPRAGLKWQFLKKHSISLGYGLHSQMQPRVIYFTKPYNPNTGEYLPIENKFLDFTKSHHFVFTCDYYIKPDFKTKIEVYYQSLFNIPVEKDSSYVALINFGTDFYIPKYESLVNEGIGKNYGIELTIEKFFNKNFYFLMTATLYDSKYKASDNIWHNTIYNGKFIMNLLGGYEIKLGNTSFLQFNLKGTWAGGKRYTPYQITTNSNGRYGFTYDYTRIYDKQYPDYLRFDFRISFKTNGKKTSDEWALDLENITNYKNVFREKINTQTGQVLKEYQIGLTWMIMYRIKF